MEYYVSLGDETIEALGDMIKEQKVDVDSKSITENGTYTAPSGKAYSPVTVNVPNPSTGTLQITENGEGIDVRQYAAVDVNVSASSDFSTAEVTVINSAAPTYGYKVVPLYDSINKILFDTSTRMSIFEESVTLGVPLPNDGVTYYPYSMFSNIDNTTPVITGDITLGADSFEIRGSGSITIVGTLNLPT